MVRYDPAIIEKFAARLYGQANRIVAICTVLFAILGALSGAVVGGLLLNRPGDPMPIILGVVVLGGLGYLLGQSRSFHLRLQAQTALCQVEIERNTQMSPRAPS